MAKHEFDTRVECKPWVKCCPCRTLHRVNNLLLFINGAIVFSIELHKAEIRPVCSSKFSFTNFIVYLTKKLVDEIDWQFVYYAHYLVNRQIDGLELC